VWCGVVWWWCVGTGAQAEAERLPNSVCFNQPWGCVPSVRETCGSNSLGQCVLVVLIIAHIGCICSRSNTAVP